MGGSTTPPMPKRPPPIPPPAEVDRPEIAQAEMEMAAPKQATTGKSRKYRVKAKESGTSKSHSKYKGGGLAGYTQRKAGNK